MNKQRRKALEEISAALEEIKAKLEDQVSELETRRDEEQEYYDNMPDSIRDGDKGSAVSEIVEALDSACDELRGFADGLEETIDGIRGAADA